MEEKSNDVSLDVGDIIWASRYKNAEEKARINRGHQRSPYVIIKKVEDVIYGLQCTSNPHQEIEWKILYYPLSKMDYQISRNSYVNCRFVERIDKNQLIAKIGKLSPKDLNKLRKYLYILKKSSFPFKPQIEDKYLSFTFEVGDIFLYQGNRYYIDAITKDYFITYLLRKKIRKDYNVFIGNAYYSFIFEKKELISKLEKVTLVDTFHSGEVKAIKAYQTSYLQKRRQTKEGKKLQVGALVWYHTKLFYIYEENKNSYLAYQVYLDTEFKENMIDILINNGIYHTYFNLAILPKYNNKNYYVKRCASKEEIKHNDLLFKTPKKERLEKRRKCALVNMLNKKRDIEDFIPMVILKNNNNDKYYLIMSRKDNIVLLVNINSMSDTFYFELEKNNCPFVYYRIMPEEEYEKYVYQVNEFRRMVDMFQENEKRLEESKKGHYN